MKYFALITYGLEDIVCDDLKEQLPELTIIEKAYRRIVFEYVGSPELLLQIKSVDDIFCFVEAFKISHQRAGLDMLAERICDCDFRTSVDLIRTCRPVGGNNGIPLSFSVNVSSVGKKNYTAKEAKDLVNDVLREVYHREIREDGLQDFTIRVFIEHEDVLVGVRLHSVPLHRRAYKMITLPGSLKPSVAYCMLRLANIHSGEVLLDPMCGVGTIVLEACLFTEHVMGGDSNAKAIEVAEELYTYHTQHHLHLSGSQENPNVSFQVRDARKLPLAEHSIDKIVTNLPFGKQISIEHVEDFLKDVLIEFRRVLKDTGNIVLLAMHADEISRMATDSGLQVMHMYPISLFGLQPIIVALNCI